MGIALMSLPATAQAIYDMLAADETLMEQLGSYTLAGGDELPAIAVLRAQERLPEGIVVEGVEVVITATPQLAPTWMLDNGYRSQPTFRIYVSQWSPETAGTALLQPVAERIMAYLPGSSSATIGLTTEEEKAGGGLGLLDQVIVRWTNPIAFVAGLEPPVTEPPDPEGGED